MQTRPRARPLVKAKLETSDLLGCVKEKILVKSSGRRNERARICACLYLVCGGIIVTQSEDLVVGNGGEAVKVLATELLDAKNNSRELSCR